MWITTIHEKFIIDHWEVQEKEKTMSFNSERFYTMNIYCHQAKVRAGYDATGLCDPQLAIFYGEHRVTTKVIKQSLSPIWNEVLTIENLRFPIPGCELFSTLVIIVLYDEDNDGVSESRLNFQLSHLHHRHRQCTSINPSTFYPTFSESIRSCWLWLCQAESETHRRTSGRCASDIREK